MPDIIKIRNLPSASDLSDGDYAAIDNSTDGLRKVALGGIISDLKSAISNLDTTVRVDEGVLQYTDNGNLYDSTNSRMLLADKYVDNSGNIVDNNTYNVILVPIFDTTGLYTLMTTNSGGTAWINNTGSCGCFDINGNKLGLATAATNGVNVPYEKTRYLAFNCGDTYLARQPMIIHNWDGVNKSAYVSYALPTASVKGLQGAIDNGELATEIKEKVKNQNGYFYPTVGYNLMNDDADGAGVGTIKPADGTIKEVSGYYHSDYIDIHENDGYITAYVGSTNFTTPSYAFQRLAFYDQNKAFIANSGVDNNANKSNLATATVAVPATAYYVRIGFSGTKSDNSRMVNFGKWYGQYYPYVKGIEYIKDDSFSWHNKTWSAYGDSITAIVNGNSPCQGWARYINEKFGITEFYGRGIGSQSFSYRDHGGSVSFINADGTYNSRNDSYNLDDYTGEVPTGCTAVRGAFCAWSRITAMYPAAIKDTIDMVFIMGGTNDASDTEEATWVENSTVDPEWAESEYYSAYGGDYNINTLKGGVASTVMKFQAWMPNAIIVIGTPLNGQTNRSGEIRPDYTPDEYVKSIKIMEVSRLFGIPCIDVFGTCGINMVNSPTYITDGTHPYNTAGHKMLARAVMGGLKAIEPNL